MNYPILLKFLTNSWEFMLRYVLLILFIYKALFDRFYFGRFLFLFGA